MTAQDRIDNLSAHLEPVEWRTHYPPEKLKRIAVRLTRTYEVRFVAWLFDLTASSLSEWRKQDLDGQLDVRQRGGTPRGEMCGTR